MDPNTRNLFFAPHTFGSSWEIIMAAGQKSNGAGTNSNFAYAGSGAFRNATPANTGASSRTAFGDGEGVYSAFFTKENITKMALVNGDGNLNDPTSNSRYIVYELVESTGAENLYDLIYRLDTYNLTTTPGWHGQDGVFGTDSARNFVAGPAKSGSVIQNSGHFYAQGSGTPAAFCIWGVNRDSDNDTQVLCAYSGNLTSGKADSWRGEDPQQTFWSYWGNDWHSNSQNQTISQGYQTSPGYGSSASGASGTIYLLAF